MGDYKETVLWTRQNSYIYKFTAIVIACTRPAHVKARQNPSIDTGGGHEVSTLVELLLATDGFWERVSVVFKDVTPE